MPSFQFGFRTSALWGLLSLLAIAPVAVESTVAEIRHCITTENKLRVFVLSTNSNDRLKPEINIQNEQTGVVTATEPGGYTEEMTRRDDIDGSEINNCIDGITILDRTCPSDWLRDDDGNDFEWAFFEFEVDCSTSYTFLGLNDQNRFYDVWCTDMNCITEDKKGPLYPTTISACDSANPSMQPSVSLQPSVSSQPSAALSSQQPSFTPSKYEKSGNVDWHCRAAEPSMDPSFNPSSLPSFEPSEASLTTKKAKKEEKKQPKSGKAAPGPKTPK